MTNNRFNKGIEEWSKEKLTSEEKRVMLECIFAVPVAPALIPSPYWVYRHSVAVSVIAAVLIVIFTASGTAWASQEALPGDLTYPIKVNVVEPIRVALAPTVTAKARVQARLADTRLQEAETLAARGTLDEPKEREINRRLNDQTAALAKTLQRTAVDAPDEARDIRIKFRDSMGARARALDKISKDSKEGERRTSVSTTTPAGTSAPAERVEKIDRESRRESVKFKRLERKDIRQAATPTPTATPTSSNSEDQYKQRRERIQRIIDTVSSSAGTIEADGKQSSGRIDKKSNRQDENLRRGRNGGGKSR